MDLRTVVIISTLFLMTNGNSSTTVNSTNFTNATATPSSNPITTASTQSTQSRATTQKTKCKEICRCGYIITAYDSGYCGSSENKASNQKCLTSCFPVCTGEGQGQLKAYKAATAFLCCILLILLLVRFTKPTLQALQKRLSDRRQNRWVGPTQSHSVSYHRGKSAVKNNDGEKRLSYPALDRLVIPDSREPSSNRNSGYNL